MKNNNVTTEIKKINSGLILSDIKYQRMLNDARVKKIVSHFNPLLVNHLKVSFRDGKYYVFDGQHTLAALRLINKSYDFLVDCKIYYGLTEQDEARLFAEQNGIARKVETNAKMKALYYAGDVEIVEFCETVTGLGLVLDFSNGKGKNKIIACKALYDIYKKTSIAEFTNILNVIKKSWNGEQMSFNREILNGMYLFFKAYGSQINVETAIKQFSKVAPAVIIRDGKVFYTSDNKKYAIKLVDIYNKKLMGKNRLDERQLIQS